MARLSGRLRVQARHVQSNKRALLALFTVQTRCVIFFAKYQIWPSRYDMKCVDSLHKYPQWIDEPTRHFRNVTLLWTLIVFAKTANIKSGSSVSGVFPPLISTYIYNIYIYYAHFHNLLRFREWWQNALIVYWDIYPYISEHWKVNMEKTLSDPNEPWKCDFKERAPRRLFRTSYQISENIAYFL